MKLYVLTYDNGQVALIHMSPEDHNKLADAMTHCSKRRLDMRWGELERPEWDTADSTIVFVGGGFVDANSVIGFLPYTPFPDEASK